MKSQMPMMKAIIRVFVLITILPLLAPYADAQEIINPKREFRAAWVASVANIDYPSVPGLNKNQLMQEWTSTLDFLEEAGFNAVFTQIRPAGDALFPSKIAPWSRYLTGKQGISPGEGFDPMEFMIDESHARNLEFHAWLNPYRASMDTIVENLSEHHPYRYHPEWFIRYGGKIYFNPALPEVRNYITEVVLEILMNYDVDGIHFDDYFYPYPAAGELFPDSADFVTYGYGFLSVEDWRRNNVNMLISQVSEMIRRVAPHVKFGVSPFGVWRNSTIDPLLGSATNAGVTTYDDLYADVRTWLERDWIDYVIPQIYWHIGFRLADYEVLLDWWQKNSFEHHVYAGHAAYKVGRNTEEAWKRPDQIPRQIMLNRAIPKIRGSVFYNTNSLKKNALGMTDSLRNNYFSTPALWPEMKSLKLPDPPSPTLGKIKGKNGKLRFKVSVPGEDKNARYIVVYRFEDRLPGDYNNPNNIYKVIRLGGENSILVEDDTIQSGKSYTYAASSMNAQASESLLSEWRAVEVSEKRVKRLK